MHPYLTRLGVRPEVQAFFAPYDSDANGGLLFQQGDYVEHFGMAFHRVDAGGDCWMAGETNRVMTERVFISSSVMDMIAFLHYGGHTISLWKQAVFIAVGVKPSIAGLSRISGFADKPMTLLFPADGLGAITDLKVAAAFRRVPAAAFLAEKERLKISFRAEVYEFEQRGFSLSAFEKASGYRFNVTTRKPRHGASFLDQLKAGAFPSY